jgi:hypothetical protein
MPRPNMRMLRPNIMTTPVTAATIDHMGNIVSGPI